MNLVGKILSKTTGTAPVRFLHVMKISILAILTTSLSYVFKGIPVLAFQPRNRLNSMGIVGELLKS